MASVFWEFVRETRMMQHLRISNEKEMQIEHASQQWEDTVRERNQLEDQLQDAYRQIDSISETLQKELKTKEELAAELRQANSKLRSAVTQAQDRPGEKNPYAPPAGRRSSLTKDPNSPRGDDRSPARLGNEGGGNFTLAEPLREEFTRGP